MDLWGLLDKGVGNWRGGDWWGGDRLEESRDRGVIMVFGGTIGWNLWILAWRRGRHCRACLEGCGDTGVIVAF